MRKYITIVDGITDWIGKKISFLILPLIAVVAFDIIIRKIAQATLWAFDVSLWLYSLIFLFGFVWTLYQKGHLSVDYFYEKYPERIQLILQLIIFLVFLLPLCYIQVVGGYEDAMIAYTRDQRSIYSPWRAVVWPMKSILPAAFLLMFFQTISEIFKVIIKLRTPKSAAKGSDVA